MLSGLLFMGSNEEQLMLLSVLNIDPSSYSNILLSFGFAVFLFALGLILLWEKLTHYLPSATTQPSATGDYSQLNNAETIHDASSDFLEDDEDEDAMQLKTRVGPNHI